MKCEKCGKSLLLFRKKFYDYGGKKKASFEITDAKTYCKACFYSFHSDEERKAEVIGNWIIKMREQEYQDALKDLEKYFDKRRKDDWYNKGNILRNLKKDKEAIKCYDEALLIDTHYVKAWYRKGQLLYENDRFVDAGKCFENVLELEKPMLDKKSLVVKATKNGIEYQVYYWSFGALIMRALSYMGEKKFDEADAVFGIFYEIVGHILPFCDVETQKFIPYCVKNAHSILDMVEPSAVAEIGTLGDKH